MATETAPKPAKQLDHRYEGIAKVTGKAKYAAEFSQPFPKADLAYAYIVQSTIPNGTIASIDRCAADRAPGVIAILTPFNAPKLNQGPPEPPARRNLSLLQDTEVHYNGQPIAVVVAKSLNEAKAAARLLKIKYVSKPAQVNFMRQTRGGTLAQEPGKGAARQSSRRCAGRFREIIGDRSRRPTSRPSSTTTRWSRTPRSPGGRAKS